MRGDDADTPTLPEPDIIGGEDNTHRCLAEQHVGRPPTTRTLVGSVLLFALGFASGYLLIDQARDSDLYSLRTAHADLQLWAVLIGALAGYALAAGLSMLRWLIRLCRLFTPRVPPMSVVHWIVGVAAILLMVFVTLAALKPIRVSTTHDTQVLLITLFVGAAAVPGLTGFMAIRSLAGKDPYWHNQRPRCQVLLVLRLRSELRRLLAAFGGLLTLVIIATAARRRAFLALPAKPTIPNDLVLLYGLQFAAILALFFVAGTSALERRSATLLDAYAPIPSPDASDIEGPLQRRNGVAALLGIETSWQATFQNGAIVVAPLITALVSSALSGH